MILQKVRISDFWGEYTVIFSLKPDMNIIIGKNGSGKTQILNIIEAALTCDVNALVRLDFKELEIEYSLNREKRILKVDKVSRISEDKMAAKSREIFNRYASIVYTLDNIKYVIIDSKRMGSDLISSAVEMSDAEVLPHESMREKLSTIFNIVVLNVHRTTKSYQDDEIWTLAARRNPKDYLNDRIEAILNRITSDQIKLRDDLANIAKEGEKRLITSLLFENRDSLAITPSEQNFSSNKLLLENTLREMDILDDSTREVIDNAFNNMRGVIEIDMKNIHRKDRRKDVEKFFNWISLSSKLAILADISKDLENKKNFRLMAWKTYISELQEFMGGKRFDFDEKGEFKAFIGNKPINILNLSSGEKQVFVMLSEAYLENKGQHIFLADEPELSLHLEWQSKIIPAMQLLNPIGQYIIVTHSPEIAGSYVNNLIDIDEAIR